MEQKKKETKEANMEGPTGPHAILTNLIYPEQEVC